MIFKCSYHVLSIFSLLEYVFDVFVVKIYFFVSKICLLAYLFSIKKLICIFIRCISEFFSIKKLICIFIRCRSEFFSNQKLICIFIRCRSEFFSIKKLICIWIFLNQKPNLHLNFSQSKNWFASSLDANLNFLTKTGLYLP